MGVLDEVVTNKSHLLRYKLSNNEVVNRRASELPSLDRRIIPVSEGKKHRAVFLEANVTGLISLKNSISYKGNEKQFILLAFKILDCMVKCENIGVDVNCFELSADKIFIDQTNNDILMILWPVMNYIARMTPKRFFEGLPDAMGYGNQSNGDLISKYRFFLMTKFSSLLHFKNYLAELLSQPDLPPNISPPHVTPPQEDLVQCPKCGFRNAYYASNCERCGSELQSITESLLPPKRGHVEGYLQRRDGSQPPVMITSPQFSIGRSRSCNLSFPDKGHISRLHSVVLREGDRFFFVDKWSEHHNGTFIDNRRIETEVKTELYNGQVIRFVTEEYIFQIVEV